MEPTKHFDIQKYVNLINNADLFEYSGKVTKVIGLTVECAGLNAKLSDLCTIISSDGSGILSEVVGFRDKRVLLMPLGELSGVGPCCRVVSSNTPLGVPVGENLLGRVVDTFGRPIDNLGPIECDAYYPLSAPPPGPMDRERITEILPLGIKAIDSLLTLGKGQRVGIFAGSGVGKSTLLGMMARNTKADVNVIVLIGERGREVRDFLEKDLKEEGLKRSVVVVATSDQPALVRLKSASAGMAIAEYFRDQGKDVLLLMDSLTRFAMAQREIGMAIGEPPVSRGYPPSVYSIMPKLLERPGKVKNGSITGLFTVLVEGDDMNEPVSDTVRGILDGHIVLTRELANSNHYPSIDVLQSVSRLMPDITAKEHQMHAGFVKNMMASYKKVEDLISIGAYKKGIDPETDRAIELWDDINEMLRQDTDENFSLDDTLNILSGLAEQ